MREREKTTEKKQGEANRKHIVCVLISVQNRISSFSERKSRKEYTTENWKKKKEEN